MRHMPMAIVSRPAFIRAAVYGLSGLIVSTGAVNDAVGLQLLDRLLRAGDAFQALDLRVNVRRALGEGRS